MLQFILCATLLNSCTKDDTLDPSLKKYFPEVRMIIQDHCMSCHNSVGTWQGRPVAFDTNTSIVQQYERIKAAVADPVSITNKRMPQDGTLTAAQIDIIVKWFEKGGKLTD